MASSDRQFHSRTVRGKKDKVYYMYVLQHAAHSKLHIIATTTCGYCVALHYVTSTSHNVLKIENDVR